MKQARAMAIGMAAATLTLILQFVVTVIVVGSHYYEWGLVFSFLITWVVILAGYLVGGVVLESVGWIARKYGIRARPNYIVLGVLLVVTTWICAVFRATANLIPRFHGDFSNLTVAVLLACIVTLIIGLRQWRSEGGKERAR